MAREPPSGHVDLATHLERDRCPDPGVDQDRGCFRIAVRPGDDVVETLLQALGEHRHHIGHAAGTTVVAVVVQHYRARRYRGRSSDRRRHRLEVVDEIGATLPGEIEQFVAEGVACGLVAVGHDDDAEPGVGDVRQRETTENRGRQHLAASLCGDRPIHDVLHRLMQRCLVQHVRHQWQHPPRDDRFDLTGKRSQERAPGALGGLVGIDVRVGAEAGHHGGVPAEFRRHAEVEIERHGDRDVGIDGADATQQLALGIVVTVGDHRAVEAEEHGVCTGCNGVGDAPGHRLVALVGYSP